MTRVTRAAAVLTLAIVPALSLGGRPSFASAAEPTPEGILPIGIPVNAFTCPDGAPLAGADPWPIDEPVIIPVCGANPEGATWLDWTPPSGSAAEVIANVQNPITELNLPAWIYAGAAFNLNNGNLDTALDDQAGVPLSLVVTDATCSTQPSSGTEPCESGSGSGSNLWMHGSMLRTFTIQSAHLTGDLTPCAATGMGGCLIGTFSRTPPPIIDVPFVDIDGNAFRGDIEWAYAEGITAGCTADRFCPRDPVRRDQMASFIDRMFELAGTTTDFFSDDEGNIHEEAINRLAAAGITFGCGPASYCPGRSVTREQMGAFIARAASLREGAGRDYFSDDDGRQMETSDDLVAAAGISGGCGPWRFCPTAPILREQMVAFLHRVVAPIDPPPFPAP